LSYYSNVAQPLTKEDFDKAIKALEGSNKINYEKSPILYFVPVSIKKWLLQKNEQDNPV